MKTRSINLKFAFLGLSICLLAFTSCDGPSKSVTPSVDTGITYNYKATLVGSSGNMDVDIKPGNPNDSESSGSGKIVVTLDGEKYTLIPSDNSIRDLKEGDALINAEFSDGNGNIVIISTDKNGENPKIEVTIPSHNGNINVVAFEDDGKEEVMVYEGMETVKYIGDNAADYLAKSNFNLVVKGDKFEGMRKVVELGPNSCVTQEYLNANPIPENIKGDFKRDGDKITLSFELQGTKVVLKVTASGNKILSETTQNKMCRLQKSLNPAMAYPLGIMDGNNEPVMGYQLLDESGGGQVFCHNGEHCEEVPVGKIALDENGHEIATDNSTYYVTVPAIVTAEQTWDASKTL